MDYLKNENNKSALDLSVYIVEFLLKFSPLLPHQKITAGLILNTINCAKKQYSIKSLEKNIEAKINECLKNESEQSKNQIKQEIEWCLKTINRDENIVALKNKEEFSKLIQEKRYNEERPVLLNKDIFKETFNVIFDLLYDEKFFENNATEKDILLALLNDNTKLKEDLEKISETNQQTLDVTKQIYEKEQQHFNLSKEIKKEVDILINNNNPQSEEQPHTDNKVYYSNFIEPLFLHKGDENVCLKNSFVFQKYEENGIEHKDDLEQRITKFIKGFDNNVLFIVGDAGSGKTSIVSWLNYQFIANNNSENSIFKDKTLVTIRLREIKNTIINEKLSIQNAILKHTKTNDIDVLYNHFKNAILVLDGYDELCLIHKDINKTEFLNDLSYFLDYGKVIVTTRPDYQISYSSLDYHSNIERIYLEHFDEQKKDEWIKKFESNCKVSINKATKDFILTNTDNGVYDTPMLLYMLASNEFSETELKNSWYIYNKVFYNTITETKYNRNFNKSEYKHDISKFKADVYKINEEIAYMMYKSGNSKFSLSTDEIKSIVQKIAKKDSDKLILENNYAICSYLKSIGENGAIEFYHNNIRDFFMCEKIFSELNTLYDEYKNKQDYTLSPYEIKSFVDKFCDLFHYGVINEKVLEFIELRAKYCKENNDKTQIPQIEYDNRFLKQFFEAMLTRGEKLTKINDTNPIQKIINIFLSIIYLFEKIYNVFLNKDEKNKSKDEKYSLWKNTEEINQTGFFKLFLNSISGLYKISFNKINFNGEHIVAVDFSNLNLKNADLRGADLRGADLRGADLSGADLRDADLRDADLRDANLTRAKLFGADLSGAYLRGADLTQENLRDAHLSCADLTRAKLFGADLSGADLRDADLTRAKLFGADLSGADLRNADLRDADLTRAKLFGADLSGAYLRGANLSGANLIGANLIGADLRGADLRGADLRNADLRGANLRGADLKGADLKDAYLSSADLTKADLRGTTLPDGSCSENQSEQVQALKKLKIIVL